MTTEQFHHKSLFGGVHFSAFWRIQLVYLTKSTAAPSFYNDECFQLQRGNPIETRELKSVFTYNKKKM